MADARNITRRSILKTAGAMGLLGSGVTAATAAEAGHPDAALLFLGERLDEVSAKYDLVCARYHGDGSDEADRICGDAHKEVANVVAGISGLTPRTVDGLRVKARAIQWCFSGDPIEFGSGETSDVRLAAQIVQALLEA